MSASSVVVPGSLQVIKRDGRLVAFDRDYIRVAVLKAFMNPAVLGEAASVSSGANEICASVAMGIEATLMRRMPSGGVVHIEDLQDQVELALMRSGEQAVAREYVLFREKRKLAREAEAKAANTPERMIDCVMPNGDRRELPVSALRAELVGLLAGIEGVAADAILGQVERAVYAGIAYEDIWSSILLEARTLIEGEPNYSFAAARILLSRLAVEVTDTLGMASFDYGVAFRKGLEAGIAAGILDERLVGFDLDMLVAALKPDNDKKIKFLGMQTLYDRYFLNIDDRRFEMPQTFLMRVAMGLAINESDRNGRAVEFYSLLSSFDYMTSTPTLFNAGTTHPQLSSCYLTTVPDDLHGIYGSIRDNAMLSKWAGGLGNDWTPVRGLGAYIKGTNGRSQGVVPFLKVANDTAVAVNQGGKRKGAVCAYLETWHIDIEEFLELRKNTGDDRRRTHDMNTANWVPDLFMKRVFEDGEWTMFSPNNVPDLHDLFGAAFEARYAEYEAAAKRGEIKPSKTVKAQDLWRKMIGMLFETGHPWFTFKDPCNVRSPQQHCGVVHSSNLCTEITLNTSQDEIAVCNLGSLNIAAHVDELGNLMMGKLRRNIRTAVRMLDNVVDINFYAVEAARTSNMRHRPVGLGLMGFQDALYKMRVPYSSQEAVKFADRSMEAISYFAIEASADLAVERGAYSTFDGSLWSKGILPLDTLTMLAAERGEQFLQVNRDSTLDWEALRPRVMAGMRNSNLMAIAPTATISNIVGVTQSIEPTYQNLYVKSNLSGEFTVINEHLVDVLRQQGLWDAVMVNDLKHYEGSLTQISRIDDATRALFATSFEVEPKWIIEAASRRQKWIDQAQSLNLYISGANGKKLDLVYRMAWLSGLKTTYYLRALAATSTEKSTTTHGALNAVSSGAAPAPAPVPKACAIDSPDCEACQ